MKSKLRYSLLFFLLAVQHGWATDPINEKNFIRYTTLDGLSDNSITGLMQDEKGFMWITTKSGVNRFDGYEFRKFYQTADPQSLIIDEIQKFWGNNNQLLFITRKGCQALDAGSFQFTKYALPETEPGYRFKNAASDGLITENGEVIMSTQTGLYVFGKNGELNFRYDRFGMLTGEPPPKTYGRNIVSLGNNLFMHLVAEKEIFIFDRTSRRYDSIAAYGNRFSNLAVLNKKVVYLKTSLATHEIVLYCELTNQLIFYNAETDTVREYKLPDFLQTEIGWRSIFYQPNDSTVIITSRVNGLFTGYWNKKTGSLQIDPNRHFADFFCNAIFQDRDKRLWIGAENGLLKQNLSEKRVASLDLKSFSQERSGHSNYEVTAFMRHHDELYVGTYSRECIYVLNAADLSYKQRISFAEIEPRCNQVWYILPASGDTLLFATQYGLLWLNCSNKHFGKVRLPEAIQPLLYNKPISIAFQDSQGFLWLQGAWGKGVVQYHPKTGYTRIFQYTDKKNFIPIQTPNHIGEDSEGNVWFASTGLTRWNKKTDRFDTLIASYVGLNKNNLQIRTLTTDSKHKLIFSNLNNGAVFFDPKSRTYNHLSTEQGLPENAVHVLLGLSDELVCIGSRNYLSVYDQQRKKLISYTYNDGVPLEGSTPYSVYHDITAKRVLTGYSNASIAWIDDTLPPSPNESIPFFIDEITVGGSDAVIYPDKELELTHQENDIGIHLSAINFTDVQNNQFFYRFNNASWVALGKLNNITLNNMTPGTYSIAVRVSSPSNRWKDAVRKITIVIQPPFWQTLWFYAVMLTIVAAIVFAFVRNHISTIRKTSDLNNSLALAEMKALHAQMNPHFIFNSLNSIKEMILQNEKDNASRYLSRFAQLIRMNLDHSRQNLITLEQNVQYLQRYLEMEKLRFDDFTYSISVDPSLNSDDIEIPPMLLQPLVENALWHGLKPKRGSKQIAIRFSKDAHQLLCEIEDNGIGINQSQQEKNGFTHQSLGIANIRERINLLNSKYQKNSRLEITDLGSLNGKPKKGTLVRLTFSLMQE